MRIVAEGLRDVAHYFERLPEIAKEAAFFAVRDVSEREALKLVRDEVETQVAFPTGYVRAGRLDVKRKATRNSLEAVIRGRDRPTSLARFAPGQNPANTRGRGVRVTVKKGSQRLLRKAFLVRLKNGNTGLAVRLKPGQTITNSDKAVRLENNVFLLYGPSVDQVFRGVAEDQAPVITTMVQRQFLRQFARLSRG